MTLFSFNMKDEIYPSSQLMFNLVSGAFGKSRDADVRCLKLDCNPLIVLCCDSYEFTRLAEKERDGGFFCFFFGEF